MVDMKFHNKRYRELNKREKEEVLEDLNQSEKRLSVMWRYLIGKHYMITNMATSGISWEDLGVFALYSIPAHYEFYKELEPLAHTDLEGNNLKTHKHS